MIYLRLVIIVQKNKNCGKKQVTPQRQNNSQERIELRILRLLQFTPMASWFRRPGMNNIGTDLYMDPGTPDGFLRMQGGSGNNNIFYHSSLE
ncbi:hypothetical protein PVIIG_06408 [Plasmodium vivax India VII]|uniref:Uncharacterized protein n=1 Tax=Plasmodium vivax India VII TaxID=1077284 RepID=A0A0J9S5J8_PLAVI|nr:hypothetical protein PVIIG_06408 [Plasmodium vivax India VII]